MASVHTLVTKVISCSDIVFMCSKIPNLLPGGYPNDDYKIIEDIIVDGKRDRCVTVF